jgi:pimeloyl-ACP methyl ester carboxylesterase
MSMANGNELENSIYKSVGGKQEIMAWYDKFLAGWPVPYQTQMVSTRYGNTHIISSGEESLPPLILIHGASSNATSWAGEVAAYSQHFHVMAIDVIGEPGKSASTRPAWEGNAYSEWLAEVIDGLHLEKVILLGISQGGWIALKYATAHPQRVTKLVLLSPGGIVPTRVLFIFKAIFYTSLGSWGSQQLNRYVYGRQPINPVVLQFMNAIMTHVKARIDKEYLFSDQELARLTMPVLLVGGTEDAIRSIEQMDARLKKHLPHLETIVIPHQGHVLMAVSDRVFPFLRVS